MKKSKTVEDYIATGGEWKDCLVALRQILQSTALQEDIKWGAPCYTLKGKNIVGLAAFKSYVGIWFHQGALLRDKAERLINAQEGVTKAQRQWRFESLAEIEQDTELIKNYVEEAIANQKQGKEIKADREKKTVIPEELQHRLEEDASIKVAFEAFTPFKQREFCEYVETAKRAETKQSRLDKILPMIRGGIGLNDKYR